jgi:hypothetical protein
MVNNETIIPRTLPKDSVAGEGIRQKEQDIGLKAKETRDKGQGTRDKEQDTRSGATIDYKL